MGLSERQDKFFQGLIWFLSIGVTALVALLFYAIDTNDVNTGWDVSSLPLFHASLNACTAVCLILGLYFIRKGNQKAHRAVMTFGFILSAIFLVSYVIYHSQTDPTPFGGEGFLKVIYYIILPTHIILAAVVLPFILFTLYRAWTGNFTKHKKLARITWPMWLYVTISGVLVYVLISPYYSINL